MEDFKVVGKVKITGEIILKAPLLIGDGAGETADNFKDIHVLKNHVGAAFIPGTSLCGVLREWLAKNNPALVEKIFGDTNKMQSSIQLEDIVLAGGEIISRDGVKIDGVTGTGIDGGKYDYEAIDRGARGDLNLLINLRGCHDETDIKNFVAKLLRKLEGGIRIGALTSKGFGFTVAENLNAEFFDFRKKADVIAWLTDKPAAEKILPAAEKISANAQDFVVDADFVFKSSFIIRDYDTNEKVGESKISAVSLKSRNDFVIPATSLKGIFRHRAEYIFGKFGLDKNLLDKLLGASIGDEKIKSRFIVAESYISPKNIKAIAHTRNKIDRITGGTLQGTLFSTKPVYGAANLHVHFEIVDAKDFEAGLAIFLLRDLWLGNVAIGGEKSIGRGTVRGVYAKINFRGKSYELDAGGKVISGDKAELAKFAAAVKNWGDSE